MFWSKNKSARDKLEAPGADAAALSKSSPSKLAAANLDDQPLDALSTVLRTLGTESFAVEDMDALTIRVLFERWMQHIVIGSSHPDDADRRPATERDYQGLTAFIQQHRKKEVQYVHRTVGDLREVIWKCLGSFGRAIEDEAQMDQVAKERFERLRSAVDRGDVAQLKREAMSTVESLEAIISERKVRQRKQMEELGTQLSKMGKELDEVKKEGSLDPLTQLYNRKAFDKYLEHTMELNAVCRQQACLLMIDADRFKSINDEYGHQGGDQVLQALSNSLSRTLLRKTDFVARFGGEEFAAILRDTGLKDGQVVCDKLMKVIRNLVIRIGDKDVRVTVSIGMAEFKDGESREQWIERADRALYAAKNNGRDCVVTETPAKA
jgi:diguanylate cyclase (GGDEF)-like protein